MHDTKLTARERRYINYCERFYFLENGGFPNNEIAAHELGYSVADVNYFLQNKKVVKALERRGLPWNQASAETDITPIQQAAAITVMNVADKRSIDQKLEDLGVNPTQYYGWLNAPHYKAFVNRLADNNLNNLRPEAVAAFVQKVRQGDFKFLKLYFEMTGEAQAPQMASLQATVQKLIEAVQRHVPDPIILAAIAKDVQGAAPVAPTGISPTGVAINQIEGAVADGHNSNN